MTADIFLAEFVRCTMPAWMFLITGRPDQVQRLLDALPAHNRHQARTAALIMWRTGLRVSEVLELEWRDLSYAGHPATLLVRQSKTRKPRTVRMHGELVQLFTNWPSNRTARDKVVGISMRTVLRHIADAVVASGLDEESPGDGQDLSANRRERLRHGERAVKL